MEKSTNTSTNASTSANANIKKVKYITSNDKLYALVEITIKGQNTPEVFLYEYLSESIVLKIATITGRMPKLARTNGFGRSVVNTSSLEKTTMRYIGQKIIIPAFKTFSSLRQHLVAEYALIN